MKQIKHYHIYRKWGISTSNKECWSIPIGNKNSNNLFKVVVVEKPIKWRTHSILTTLFINFSIAFVPVCSFTCIILICLNVILNHALKLEIMSRIRTIIRHELQLHDEADAVVASCSLSDSTTLHAYDRHNLKLHHQSSRKEHR